MFVGLVWPMVFAFVASLLVSVTLIPLLAAWVLKPLQLSRDAAGCDGCSARYGLGFSA